MASIPDLRSAAYCGDADFVFDSTGFGLRVSNSEVFDFRSGNSHWGWKWDQGSNIYITDEQDVASVVVDGKVLMREGEMLTIDTERVVAEANALAAKIQAALNERNQ